MLSQVNLYCFLLSYLVALGLEGFGLARRRAPIRATGIGFTAAGLLAHTAYLVNRSQQANLPPLLSSTQDWLLVLAWLVVVLYLAIIALDRNLPLGVFMLPAVLVLIGVASFASDDPHHIVADLGDAASEQEEAEAARERGMAIRRWTMLHAATLVVGTGGVLMGFVLSLMYLIQHRRLRAKVTGEAMVKLPNLEKLAALNWWSVVIAVPLLTLGLLAGVILGQLLERSAADFRFSDPTVIAHTVVWVVMASLFYRLLKRRDLSGKTVAWQTVWAFGFLIATIASLVFLAGRGALDSFHSGAPPASAEVSSASSGGGR